MPTLVKDTVIVPIDFSDESYQALEIALDLVNEPSCVHIVHVLFELSAVEPAMVWETISKADRIWSVKKSIQEKLQDEKYRDIPIEVLFGDAGTEIAAYAERVKANLIVLPSHGRTGLNRLLIGSVAERVVRLAHCPVLVLRQ